MTDARWLDVEDDLGAAIRHFGNAARLYEAGGFDAPDLDGYRARMGLQHAMQAGHTSLEGALHRILDILGEDGPTGPNSHADLIRRVSRPVSLPDRSGPRPRSRPRDGSRRPLRPASACSGTGSIPRRAADAEPHPNTYPPLIRSPTGCPAA
ncbi:hypothetical protein [Methylobacterium sp. J-067]|uniref:ribonuclease toxin HepT-like protein n=1 Tax=Methylobacterium sp. J-067 TaxID=2836648 RepID=UPI001FB9A33B|nr:hypothetical protein [Methylobacterium sp. J-067]MCJ2022882.1 hypothetical protein [Methylobacterium sp. J-067]